MSWSQVSRDTIVNGDYYITRTRSAHGWYYNGWKGKHDDRDLREHIDAGWNVEAVKGACERHAVEGK